ncbi:citrulline utilization hydrolase CtlX [Desulfosediminicola flagellatus]|uniref:citrulline utilization hydrolase CtlX n=1 Tax=Desulfosediminicola flagellatus TaxID=2569541 RepID=UPI0010ABA02F|nr:arginine deiminase-related protein [Desulfosediminicola flagellatus]
MSSQFIQAPGAIVMIRPHRFHPNPETASDNAFQRTDGHLSSKEIARLARREVTEVAARLEQEGVRVHIFEDLGEKETPDSVFPNNWFSTHSGGHIAIYPMFNPSRRRERRYDIIEMLKSEYRVQDVIDYSCLEYDDLFLEGTGAMVLDHIARVAYTARSNRADPIPLERFCTHFNFEPMAFDTADEHGNSIYHTNVMMCIGTEFALVGFDIIRDPKRKEEIRERIQDMGREVISLTNHQINEFAGNAMELAAGNSRILAISTRAATSLLPEQKEIIEQSAKIVELSVPTIELAGGSIRCMMAGIHLAKRH